MDECEPDICVCKNCQEVIPDGELCYLIVPYEEGDGVLCQQCAFEMVLNEIDGTPIKPLEVERSE
jgi:hypothetical protein